MWQVSNDINKQVLYRYSFIIENIFQLLIEISGKENKLELLKDNLYLAKVFDGNEYLNSKLLTINRSPNDTFIKLLIEIIKLDKNTLENEFKIYKEQNDQINNTNYNLNEENHPESLIKLFKDYFYDTFFGVAWIWSDLVGKNYTRGMFKTDFLDENKLYVCPYCDTDTISNIRNSWIEHFLPKSKFPYISCNVNNLMPSCTSCNVSGTGKGEDIKNPIINQFSSQIGDQLEFEYKDGKIFIPENENPSVENFVELLKLRKRYGEKNVNSRIISSLKNNYNIVLQLKNIDEFDNELFIDYIHNNGRNNGIYFVQKNILKYIDQM